MQLVVGRIGSAPLEAFVAQFRALFPRPAGVQNGTQYLLGLASELPRKNVERMVEVLPDATVARLQQFAADTPWDPVAMDRQRIQLMVAAGATDRREGVWCFDDTGLPKQGRRSVGVKRQYCGQVGKVANCQVVVTAHCRAPPTRRPLGTRLSLPDDWAGDAVRRGAAQVPDAVAFAAQPALALALLDELRAPDIPHAA